jgi:NAD+ synthase (glutamine-hydrolysing)
MTLKLCVAQLNLTVGDLAGNASKIIAAAREAYAAGARLIVTQELSICGYPPEDLLLRPAFMAACDEQVARVASELADLKGLHVIVGHPTGNAQRGKSVSVQRRIAQLSGV